MRNGKTQMKAELENPQLIKDLKKPRFDMSDILRHKLRIKEWMPCGPDDTYPHFWKCTSCEATHAFSAK
jgi:hypothetical protein